MKKYQFVFTDSNNNIITSMMIDANKSIDVNELGDDIANALAKQLTTVVTTSISGVIVEDTKEITIVFEHNGKEVHRTTRTVSNSNSGCNYICDLQHSSWQCWKLN